MLHRCEMGAARRRLHPQHVLHHEYPWLEVSDIAEVFAEEQSAKIVLEPIAVIGAIHLTRPAKALARRPTNDHIDLFIADDFHKIGWPILRQVLLSDALVVDFREVCAVRCDRFLIEINRRETAKAGAFHPEAEPAAAAEEVQEGWCFHLHARTPSQSSDIVTPSAFASRTMLSRLGFRTPRSMPLM